MITITTDKDGNQLIRRRRCLVFDNVDPDKRDVSVVGMKKLLDQLGISYSTLYRWITEKDIYITK